VKTYNPTLAANEVYTVAGGNSFHLISAGNGIDVQYLKADLTDINETATDVEAGYFVNYKYGFDLVKITNGAVGQTIKFGVARDGEGGYNIGASNLVGGIVDEITVVDEITNVSSVDLIDEVTNVSSVDLVDEVTNVSSVDLVDEVSNVSSVDLVDEIDVLNEILDKGALDSNRHVGSTYLSVGSSLRTTFQLRNPAASGVRLLVRRATIQNTYTATQTFYCAHRTSNSNLASIADRANKFLGDADGAGVMSMAGVSGLTGTTQFTRRVGSGLEVEFIREESFIVDQGDCLILYSGSQQTEAACIFEWAEIPV